MSADGGELLGRLVELRPADLRPAIEALSRPELLAALEAAVLDLAVDPEPDPFRYPPPD